MVGGVQSHATRARRRRVVRPRGPPGRRRPARRLYREILVPSFRRDELVPYESLADSLTQDAPITDIAAAWKDPGEILGAIVGDWDPVSRVYLLSYLAVRPASGTCGAAPASCSSCRSGHGRGGLS